MPVSECGSASSNRYGWLQTFRSCMSMLFSETGGFFAAALFALFFSRFLSPRQCVCGRRRVSLPPYPQRPHRGPQSCRPPSTTAALSLRPRRSKSRFAHGHRESITLVITIGLLRCYDATVLQHVVVELVLELSVLAVPVRTASFSKTARVLLQQAKALTG